MRHSLALSAAAVALLFACSAPGAEAGKAADLALNQAPSKTSARLDVTSAAFRPGGDIPKTYSAFGEGASPPLAWSPGPAGTKSYAVIVEDPDAPTPRPVVHWVVFNIPAESTSIEQNQAPAGAAQGNNTGGVAAWRPLKPPPGPAHGYRFQVFALDAPLGLAQGAGRDQVVDAMKGHVLATGELVGRFKAS